MGAGPPSAIIPELGDEEELFRFLPNKPIELNIVSKALVDAV